VVVSGTASAGHPHLRWLRSLAKASRPLRKSCTPGVGEPVELHVCRLWRFAILWNTTGNTRMVRNGPITAQARPIAACWSRTRMSRPGQAIEQVAGAPPAALVVLLGAAGFSDAFGHGETVRREGTRASSRLKMLTHGSPVAVLECAGLMTMQGVPILQPSTMHLPMSQVRPMDESLGQRMSMDPGDAWQAGHGQMLLMRRMRSPT
jgi:hypothetical protein